MAMQETHVFTRDNLFCAASQIMPVVNGKGFIAQSDEIVRRGTVINTFGKPADAESEVFGVLAEDVDTSAGAKEAAVYFTGEFNKDALIFAEGAVADDVILAARKVCIFFK